MPPTEIESIYKELIFGPAPEDRPYAVCNMVSTIDGKILSGERDEPVHDLGSKNDHRIMQRIESQCDAVLVGANSLRASPGWHFLAPLRVTVTKSGNLDYSQPFFEGAQILVAAPPGPNRHEQVGLAPCPTRHASKGATPPQNVAFLPIGEQSVDLPALLKILRQQYHVQRLLVLGGSELNAQLLRMDVIDEMFLTLAPKVKLGRDVPTYADGEALKREELLGFALSEVHRIGDEVFLRYSRRRN